MLPFGQATPFSLSMQMKWYRRAATRSYANAQFSLGFRYEMGLRVPKDDSEAVKWYCRAAEHGHGVAQDFSAQVAARSPGEPAGLPRTGGSTCRSCHGSGLGVSTSQATRAERERPHRSAGCQGARAAQSLTFQEGLYFAMKCFSNTFAVATLLVRSTSISRRLALSCIRCPDLCFLPLSDLRV